MSETTAIQWCDHTFNPWIGCAKVDAMCKHCYAHDSTPTRTARAKGLELWGVNAARRVTSDANWKLPMRWNRAAARDGVRRRVFCASLADVFEDREDLAEPRERLFGLIEEASNLDWLMLTKRPENIMDMVPESWRDEFPRHVWMGTSAGTQKSADERIPLLLECPAAVRFVSAEPLLVPVDLTNDAGFRGDYNWLTGEWYDWGDGTPAPRPDRERIGWVIVGSESGRDPRPMDVEWAASIVRQCRQSGVPCFVKQIANEHDKKGGNPKHWPEGDWPREFPR